MKTIVEQPRLPGMPPPPPAKHHKHGMSKLNALAACPGFTSREGTNGAAEDGSRLHDVMQKTTLCACIAPSHLPSAALPWVLGTNPVSEEEQFYLEFCCRELDSWFPKIPGFGALPLEGVENASITQERCDMEGRIHIYNPDGSELNYGTYDVLIFLSDEVAILFDWKFGWIPVPPAERNEQGKGYAVGVFQKYPKLKKVGVVFVQPKLHQVTRAMYQRQQLPEMYAEIKGIITATLAENKTLRPCSYCDFCAVSGTCKALLNEAQRAVALHEQLPMPPSFVGLQIDTPEEAARALYVLGRLEVLISESGLKERAKELARANNGKLSCKLPNGEEVTVELRQRNAPRSANSPLLIADTLKDVLSAEQVLAACDPKITRLEEIFAQAYVDKMEAEAKEIVQQAIADAAANPAMAKEIQKAAQEKAKAIRVTKKHAIEILNDALMSEGCLSAPEGKVDYLKIRVEKPIKQIN